MPLAQDKQLQQVPSVSASLKEAAEVSIQSLGKRSPEDLMEAIFLTLMDGQLFV